MKWIDTHVHIFSRNTEAAAKGPLLKTRNDINDTRNYLDELSTNTPEAVVVVDFSHSENSEHVIEAVKDLHAQDIAAAGVIKGDVVFPQTTQWLQMEAIKAVRVYAKEAVPLLSGNQWEEMFALLRAENKHILVFGNVPYLAETVAQIPEDITVVIDHLGLPVLTDLEGYKALLATLQTRGNVYIKGPGYRTSLDIEKVVPFVRAAKSAIGSAYIMLGATDAPFAGPVLDLTSPHKGEPLSDFVNYQIVTEYTHALAAAVADSNEEMELLLYNNAKKLYGF